MDDDGKRPSQLIFSFDCFKNINLYAISNFKNTSTFECDRHLASQLNTVIDQVSHQMFVESNWKVHTQCTLLKVVFKIR